MSPVSSPTVIEDSSSDENRSPLNLTSSSNGSSPNYLVIPDMFMSFLAEKGRVNVHYQDVKDESIAWLAEWVGARYHPLHVLTIKFCPDNVTLTPKESRLMSKLTSLTSPPVLHLKQAKKSVGITATGWIG